MYASLLDWLLSEICNSFSNYDNEPMYLSLTRHGKFYKHEDKNYFHLLLILKGVNMTLS